MENDKILKAAKTFLHNFMSLAEKDAEKLGIEKACFNEEHSEKFDTYKCDGVTMITHNKNTHHTIVMTTIKTTDDMYKTTLWIGEMESLNLAEIERKMRENKFHEGLKTTHTPHDPYEIYHTASHYMKLLKYKNMDENEIVCQNPENAEEILQKIEQEINF